MIRSEVLPPQSADAEQSTLGAALISRTAAERMLEMLEPGDFYNGAHQAVCEAIAALLERDEPADVLTVPEELKRRGKLDQIGGLAYVNTLAECVPTAAHVDYYAEIVAERSTRRRLIEATTETVTEAYGTDLPLGDLLYRARERVEAIALRRTAGDVRGASEWFQEATEHVVPDGEAVRAVPSGWPSLDRILSGGVKPGHLGLVAARPSMGKSTICSEWALNAARRGHKVLFCTLEMTRQEVAERMLASAAQVSLAALVQRKLPTAEFVQVGKASDELRTLPLWVFDNPEATVADLRGHIRRLTRKHAIELVIIDQLQTIQSPKDYENENVRFSRIAYALKAMARRLEVGVILQAQLNRDVEKREDKRPRLSDLRDSGSLENCADWTLLLYRDKYYRRSEEGFQDDGCGPIEVNVPKHRGGSPGQCVLQASLAQQRFWDESSHYGDEDAPPDRRSGND